MKVVIRIIVGILTAWLLIEGLDAVIPADWSRGAVIGVGGVAALLWDGLIYTPMSFFLKNEERA